MLYNLQTKRQRIKRFIKYQNHILVLFPPPVQICLLPNISGVFLFGELEKKQRERNPPRSSAAATDSTCKSEKTKTKQKNSTVSVSMIKYDFFFSSDHTWYDMDSFRSLQGGFDFYSSSGLMHPSSESFSFGTLKDITLFFFFNSHLQQHNAKTKEQ